MPKSLSLALLTIILTMLVSPNALSSDQNLLRRFGGVYEGLYRTGYNERFQSGLRSRGPGVRYQGRVAVPRRNGKQIKGSFLSGLGRIDFRQRVRKIKCKRSSAIYRGRLILKLREGDNPDGLPPFVGIFRAEAFTTSNGEFFRIFYKGSHVIDTGEDVKRVTVQGGFHERRNGR